MPRSVEPCADSAGPGSFELDALRNPALLDRELEARHVYGVSLAMVSYIIDHGGQPTLQLALRDVHGADAEHAIETWNTLYPRIDYEAVLDSLALKLFGIPLAQLDGILDGPLCCHGLSDVTEISCRAATPRATTRVWFETWSDRSTTPRAQCRTKW